MHKNYKIYVEKILSGDRRFLAKTITLIESTCEDHQKLGQKILDNILPKSGNAIRIGITGVPGVGKSTFIESFGNMLTKKNHKVAVLAIDPSSSISGGSIMADKTRMEKLSADPNAFIRPSPSGGTLGGVTRMTRETAITCEAAGFDIIIIETVGVGQSETSVASMVDFFLVLLLSGAGDTLQGIKKGVLELADALAINKADGDNYLNAQQAKKAYSSALQILKPISPNWSPPVLTCSATTPDGLEVIWEQIMLHNKILSDSGELIKKRNHQLIDWMLSTVENGLRDRFFKQSNIKNELNRITKAVKNKKLSPTKGAEILLSMLY